MDKNIDVNHIAHQYECFVCHRYDSTLPYEILDTCYTRKQYPVRPILTIL